MNRTSSKLISKPHRPLVALGNVLLSNGPGELGRAVGALSRKIVHHSLDHLVGRAPKDGDLVPARGTGGTGRFESRVQAGGAVACGAAWGGDDVLEELVADGAGEVVKSVHGKVFDGNVSRRIQPV
jgi:hypothetical protein